ncbi:efflux RND transporter periplasmic adaptor subunit [Marinobacterium arenosum]|uniref:efflux RND transporter periplasmic adaptor subunit n=1 Tax=Marinobacterium arenosum TaxID=2862496 RepID=UPI001C94AD8F|nr:efflux RND transporter periplasmic adaptor subunit [Marinobacterium arenosum]MBY4677502.1 efflux RND transporter periplasmic adaptor subunit [Marinobacterium arenosum]
MRVAFLSLVSLLALLLVGCNEPPAPVQSKSKPHLVETATALRQTIAIERERTGTLRALQEIQIYNQEEGRITALPFYEGDRVSKGQVVAQLDDRLLRAQLARTQALRIKAQKDLKRIQGLVDRRLTAQSELTRVETELAVARANEQALATRLDYTTLRSPISGVVSQRLSETGNIAERYTHLLTISDQSSLITEVSVSELLINKLKLDDPVELTIDALAGRQSPNPLPGRITRIYPNLDPVTRTGTVEIALQPVPVGARPGQLARVRLRTQQAERLLIPFVALRRSSQGEYVFTVDAQQRAQIVPVVTGLRIGDEIEILSGLGPGDQVVVRGFTNLRAGTQVAVVINEALPGGAGTASAVGSAP